VLFAVYQPQVLRNLLLPVAVGYNIPAAELARILLPDFGLVENFEEEDEAQAHPGLAFEGSSGTENQLLIRRQNDVENCFLRLPRRWHIYAESGPIGISQPTRLDLHLPDGVEADGDWVYPEPVQGDGSKGTQLIYEGDVLFRRRLKVTDAASSGRLSVGCEITYQACDAFSCRPPESLKLEAVAEVVQAP